MRTKGALSVVSKPRTLEQRRAIAERCAEIEADGGDVLSYLRSENYVSARATWHNIQYEFFGRDKAHLTEGKPTGKKRAKARLKPMEKPTVISPPVRQKYNRLKGDALKAVEEEAIRIFNNGGQPIQYLREQGYKSPSGTWWGIKRKDTLGDEPEKPVDDPITPIEPITIPPAFSLKELRRGKQVELMNAVIRYMAAEGDDVEQIENEMYFLLNQIMAIRETARLGRKHLKEVAV